MHKYLQIIELNPTFFGKWNISQIFVNEKIKLWKAVGQQNKNTGKLIHNPSEASACQFLLL